MDGATSVGKLLKDVIEHDKEGMNKNLDNVSDTSSIVGDFLKPNQLIYQNNVASGSTQPDIFGIGKKKFSEDENFIEFFFLVSQYDGAEDAGMSEAEDAGMNGDIMSDIQENLDHESIDPNS